MTQDQPKIEKRVAGYVRVSTDDQAEKYGLVVQRERITAYCVLHALPEPVFYADVETGKRADTRKDFQRMLVDVAERRIDTIIALRIDRFGRSVSDLVRFHREHCAPVGASFVCVEQGFDTRTAAGRMIFHMFGAVAEYERDVIIDRITSGKKAAREAGQWGGGLAPYGYRCSGLKDGALAVDEAEAEVVRLMFERSKQKHTPGYIADVLTTDGIRTRKGHAWSDMAIRRILARRAFYEGGEDARGVVIRHDPILQVSDGAAA